MECTIVNVNVSSTETLFRDTGNDLSLRFKSCGMPCCYGQSAPDMSVTFLQISRKPKHRSRNWLYL